VGTLWAALDPVSSPGLVVFGLGMGFTISLFTVAVQESAPPTLRGMATSAPVFARSVGGALAMPLLAGLAGLQAGVTEFSAVEGLDAGIVRVFVGIAITGCSAALVGSWYFPDDLSKWRESGNGIRNTKIDGK
jgi:hypothetical protein